MSLKPTGMPADSPARSSGAASQDNTDELLFAMLQKRKANAARRSLKAQDQLRARATALVGEYAEECRAAGRVEEGKIKTRLEAYQQEDARLASEIRETEVALLELLQSQVSDVKIVVAAVQSHREALGEAAERVGEHVAQLAAEHSNAIAEELEKLWLLEGEVPKAGDGEGHEMHVDG